MYSLESAPSVSGKGWTPIATNLPGTGHEMEFIFKPEVDSAQFYRVRLAD
jgi:hypothetical protein